MNEQERAELDALKDRISNIEHVLKSAGGQLAGLALADGLRRVIGALKTVAGHLLSIRTGGER
jgi:hypothetical protein